MRLAATAKRKTQRNADRGFTLLEVMISAAIITIGLCSMLAVFGVALAATQNAQEDMIAKQLASEAMESIFTARDTSQLGWNLINNVSNGGIFVDNPQFNPINNAGADGIVGTTDDAVAGAQTLQLPGADGIVGTADDPAPLPLTNFQRSISITPVVTNGVTAGDLRMVTITVQYTTSQFHVPKNYVLTAYISQYR